MSNLKWLAIAALFCVSNSLPLGQQCSAQNFPQQSLDQIMNQVDRPQSWNNVPVAGSNPRQVLPGYRGPSSMGPQTMQRPNPFASGQQFAPVGGMRQPLQSGPPPFSKQSLMRIFFDGGGFGGGGSGSNPGQDASIVGTVEGYLQTARNQCSQAEGDASTAAGGGDKWSKQTAASSAQYHANAARGAADSAYSISYGKSQTAQNYAAQARNAANQAQAAADRARYNADTAH